MKVSGVSDLASLQEIELQVMLGGSSSLHIGTSFGILSSSIPLEEKPSSDVPAGPSLIPLDEYCSEPLKNPLGKLLGIKQDG